MVIYRYIELLSRWRDLIHIPNYIEKHHLMELWLTSVCDIRDNFRF
jgi:hypothetical protein